MGLKIWAAEYMISKISVSEPDSFLVLVHSHLTSENGPAIAGYDGPQFHIPAKEPGIYIIRFDSTSEFRADMADSAVFTARPSNAVRSSTFKMNARGPVKMYRLNGERIYHPDSTPAPTRLVED
jgi:hypothetical protein